MLLPVPLHLFLESSLRAQLGPFELAPESAPQLASLWTDLTSSLGVEQRQMSGGCQGDVSCCLYRSKEVIPLTGEVKPPPPPLTAAAGAGSGVVMGLQPHASGGSWPEHSFTQEAAGQSVP